MQMNERVMESTHNGKVDSTGKSKRKKDTEGNFLMNNQYFEIIAVHIFSRGYPVSICTIHCWLVQGPWILLIICQLTAFLSMTVSVTA